ncbi:glycosyltransferase [Candidatus Falkowbacteria bacterium]|nr:glycosyltransferase [Candidatus Falkowbacteria bacterium]
MNKEHPKLVVGFIIFGQSTAKYLPFFLPSLKAQTYQDFKAIAYDSLYLKDNGKFCPVKDDSSGEYLRENYPKIKIIDSFKNTGFARSHNKLIDEARKAGAKYYLVINCDTVLEPDALEKMLQVLDSDQDLAAVCPRIMKWDFENNKKTDIIDSSGIGLKAGLRFYDIGQGEKYNEEDLVEPIGPSGACGLYRIDVLEKIAESGKYFDENMFMYKEDCDLAYRLQLAGYKTKCIKEAVVYHDRTASGKAGILNFFSSRRNKSVQVKKWSFLNQQMIHAKYFRKQDLFSKILIVLWQIKAFVFTLLFEQYLLLEYFSLIKKKASLRKY